MRIRIGEEVVRAEEVVDEKVERPFAFEPEESEVEFDIYVGHIRPQLN